MTIYCVKPRKDETTKLPATARYGFILRHRWRTDISELDYSPFAADRESGVPLRGESMSTAKPRKADHRVHAKIIGRVPRTVPPLELPGTRGLWVFLRREESEGRRGANVIARCSGPACGGKHEQRLRVSDWVGPVERGRNACHKCTCNSVHWRAGK